MAALVAVLRRLAQPGTDRHYDNNQNGNECRRGPDHIARHGLSPCWLAKSQWCVWCARKLDKGTGLRPLFTSPRMIAGMAVAACNRWRAERRARCGPKATFG